jgi:ABC-2 type transport system ATP-binding protein/lipopolysaccharide transport system ATP-binding protein
MSKRIELDKVSVDIPILDAGSRSLRHLLMLAPVSKLIKQTTQGVGGRLTEKNSGVVVIRALDNVNLTFEDGDRVAILGHNGSGKSTMLRVIAGIYHPTEGIVKTRGRIMTLFNMMEGMDPNAKGIETIRVRGALMGLSDTEINEKIDEITEFCGLGDYINLPVRTYSTGMLVRLMFGISTCVSSEILLMDEFIGAGDAEFFGKAHLRLKRFVDQSRTLVVATHSPQIVSDWCNKAVLLKHGRVVVFGSADDVLQVFRGQK